MLVLVQKHFSANRYYGLSFHMDFLIPPMLSSGLPVRYVFVDLLASERDFMRTVETALADEDVLVIGSIHSPYLTRSFLKGVRRAGKKIVTIYGESYRLWASYKNYRPYQKHYWYHDKISAQKRQGALSDLIVQLDQGNTDHPEKTIYFPTFQSPHIFFPTAVNGKSIDVSFVGTHDRPERIAYINACPGIFVTGGGMGVERLPLDRYADMIRSSKLSLNVTPLYDGQDLLNGRITQILYSRSTLMTPDGPNVRRFFEPGKDFIPIEGPGDFADKVAYYLEHEGEREEIAWNGWKKATEHYTFERLWEQVAKRLGP